jgi:hypothetical protein
VVPALFFQFLIGPQTRINPRINGTGILQVKMPSLLAEQARQNTPPCQLIEDCLTLFQRFLVAVLQPIRTYLANMLEIFLRLLNVAGPELVVRDKVRHTKPISNREGMIEPS